MRKKYIEKIDVNKLKVDGEHTIPRNTAATGLVNNKFRSISLQVHTWTYIRIKTTPGLYIELSTKTSRLTPHTSNI